MKSETTVKTGFSALSAVIAFYTGKMTGLIWLLVLFEAADYITGIVSACMSRRLSSVQAFKGFIKKLCYFVLVGVGFGVDYLIMEVVGYTGLEFSYPAVFGVLTVCYLLSTEAISILENLSELGLEVPFLGKFVKNMRVKISEKGGEKE